ncbi:aldose epimerase family protein [Cohaesibacter celericrescens]|uniref:Aldose 1-epimerase n=1 Tax=Cohaesibacter celericrescens TaxID=2067669 RepID=A0A2N5XME0_9HYPH|nr:aldose epimerase family protein [Cohaesibacter celericrescens]PLW75655.1 galactose-1-epimerase [Cohaesibacter celericrescens]
MSVEQFGIMPDGTAVERVTITGGGLSAKILSYGAILQDLRLEGHAKPLVLGFDALEDYFTYKAHVGATAGRVANRIRDGRFELGGKIYQLDINFAGKHSLHGGTKGIGLRVWNFDKIDTNAVHMSLQLADGEMGYPGNMTIKLVYTLLDNGVLDLDMKATSDADTLCNLAHHGYFNLDGEGDILDHELQIDSDRYLDVTAELIPTGKILSVDGQSVDFRKKKSIRSAHDIKPIDNNFCIEETAGSLRRVATLSSPKSGVSMDVLTTEPGLQAYDAVNLKAGMPALDGGTSGPCGGFCLEPQIWPDAIHHPNFPSAVLKAGETYHQQTQYAFRKV